MQDIYLLLIFILLLIKRKPEWFIGAGLILILFSIPLFQFWIFFTAQKLIWYAGALILFGISLKLYKLKQ